MTKLDANGTHEKRREHMWAVGKQFGFFYFKNQSNFVKPIFSDFWLHITEG